MKLSREFSCNGEVFTSPLFYFAFSCITIVLGMEFQTALSLAFRLHSSIELVLEPRVSIVSCNINCIFLASFTLGVNN